MIVIDTPKGMETIQGHRPGFTLEHLEEWQSSGVLDEVISLNLSSEYDADTITSNLNIPAKRLESYESVLEGGWVCRGYVGTQFKADNPRSDKKGKVIKYEAPIGDSNRYSLLNIPNELFNKICLRWGVDPDSKLPSETHWAFFQRSYQIPVAVVEGVKKAGCWISQLLMPCIALHGHAALNVYGEKESAIAAFYHSKRKIFLNLDNDPGYSPRKAVDTTITTFKNNLAEERKVERFKATNQTQINEALTKIALKYKCDPADIQCVKEKKRKTMYTVVLPKPVNVLVVSLPKKFKGCDDLWVEQGAEGLEKAIAKAKPIERFIQSYRKCLGYKVAVEFSSTKWEADIPSDRRLVVLIGGKGSGKTFAMRKAMLAAKKTAEPIVYLSPRRSLNKQTAEIMNLVFVEAQEVIESNQIALCPQSLHKVPVEKFKGCTFIWDETTQCLQELILSSTTNKDRETLLTNLVLLLSNAKQVIGADADFDYNNLNLLKGLTNETPYIILNSLAANKYTAYVTKGVYTDNGMYVAEDLIKIASELLAKGQKIAIYTGSQAAEYKFSSTNLGLFFTELGCNPNVIDSETIRDPSNQSFQCMHTMREFYALAHRTNPTIYTQTLGTGFSIEENNLYAAIFGIFNGVGTPDAARQGIMRYRPFVPRYLFIAERGKTDDFGHLGMTAQQVKQSLNRKLQYLRKSLQKIDSSLIEENPEIKVNELLDTYVCEIIANNNYYNAHYYETAIQGLENDGAEVIDITGKTDDLEINEQEIYPWLKKLSNENDKVIKKEIIASEVLSDEEYEDLKRQNTIRKSEQRAITKTNLSNRYGIEVTEELIQKDKDGWYKQLKAQYSATLGYGIIKARAQINHLAGIEKNYGDLFNYTRRQNTFTVAELLHESKLFERLLDNPAEKNEVLAAVSTSQDEFDDNFEACEDQPTQRKKSKKKPIPITHKITLHKDDAYTQELYRYLVQNIQKLNDCLGLRIKKTTFQEDKFDFKLISLVCAYLGVPTAKIGASENRKYVVGIPDDGREQVFEYWLAKEQSYLEKHNTWQREREIQKVLRQIALTMRISDFQALKGSEYFDAAWEKVAVYDRTVILNREDKFTVPETKTFFLNPSSANFQKALADIKSWTNVSVDLETYGMDKKNKEGLHYRKGRIRFIQISNGVNTYIIDCGHRGQTNQVTDWRNQKPSLTPFFEVLNEKLSNPDVKIIGQNIHFDLRFLRFNGFDTATNVQDTLKGVKIFLGDSGGLGVLGAADGSRKPYGLGNLVYKLLGLVIDKTEQKSDWGRADITESQITYAANDPHLTFYVYEALEKWYTDPTRYGFKKLAQAGLREAWQLENDVIPATVEMELTGIPIDRGSAQQLLDEYKELQVSLLKDWSALVPGISYAQTAKLKEHLINKYDRQIPKLNKETLAELTDLDEVKVLQKLRAVKIPIQQLEVFLRSSEATGRIQTVFNSLTGTGRFSSGMSKVFDDMPNLQSVSAKAAPALKEYKKEGIRSVVRQTNMQKGFAVIDLAGAHGRIAADVANDKNAIAGNNDTTIDNHSKVAVFVASALGFDLDWQTIKEASKDKTHQLHKQCKMFRDTAKNTFYGWLNGAGAKRVQAQIKANSGEIVSLEACQAAIKGCEELYPDVVNFRTALMKYMQSDDALITVDGTVYTINKVQMVNNRILHKADVTTEQISLPYTQILAAIWSRTEATALKRAFVKIQDVIKQNPLWELKVINYVHDEMNFEFNIEYAEAVITKVRDVIGNEFQKCLQYVKDGREPNWMNLLVNSWADK